LLIHDNSIGISLKKAFQALFQNLLSLNNIKKMV